MQTPYPLATRQIFSAGKPVVAAYGPLNGGIIFNPATPVGQGLDAVEPLYVDVVNPASVSWTPTTVVIQPGGKYQIPSDMDAEVSVNAVSAGHKFTGFVYQAPTPYPPTPQSGTWPPSGPTTLQQILPSYPYQQYDDDEDIVAFFSSFNGAAQAIFEWFLDTPLAIYTNENVSGPLLDWVGQGVYNQVRPALLSNKAKIYGPVNTYGANFFLPLNARKTIGPDNVVATTDDVYRRIITWNFYKGDGNRFNVNWLKRRVIRFLLGTDGVAIDVPETYDVSVSIGASTITIKLGGGTRQLTGGALPNRFGPNSFIPINSIKSTFTSAADPFQFAPIFKEAVDGGFLVLPLQYSYSIII